MTDRFTLIDAGLWSVAAALLFAVVWIVLRDRPDRWDPAVLFGGVLGALFAKGNFPLREGPVPPEGWDGEVRDLEPVYEPSARLAPDLNWEAVKAWTPAVEAAIARRLSGVRLLCVDAPPCALPGLNVEILPIEALGDAFTRSDERAIFVAGESADGLLRALHASPALRDRARAVLLWAPALDRTFLPSIDHTSFEVEVAREVPYLTLRSGPAAADQVLPVPPKPANGILSITTIDLGILPEDLLGDARVGRALSALFAAL